MSQTEDMDRMRDYLGDRSVPDPPGELVGVRYVMRRDAWYAETGEGWHWWDPVGRAWRWQLHVPD